MSMEKNDVGTIDGTRSTIQSLQKFKDDESGSLKKWNPTIIYNFLLSQNTIAFKKVNWKLWIGIDQPEEKQMFTP